MKNFFGHVFVTFRGALVGQLIPVAAMPVITRLYDPVGYGIFVSILSIGAILSVFSMLQLEVAVVLPRDEKEGDALARTAFQTGLMTTLLLYLGLFLLYPFIEDFGGMKNLGGWVFFTPFLGFLLSLASLFNYVAGRLRHYREIGASAAALQLANCGCAILFGLKSPEIWGLITARLTGQMAAVAVYRKSVAWLWRHFRAHGLVSFSHMWELTKTYRKFPLFTLPYTLVSTLSRESVVIILIFFHHPQAAGFYALVRSVLMMPVSLLSTSVGQIFYREASASIERPEFRQFSFMLMIAIAIVVAPACVYIAYWGPEIFALVFGAEWRGAGIFAILYMPLSLLFIISGWLSRIFEVTHRQDLLFRIQIAFDALSLVILYFGLQAGWTPPQALGGYVGVQCVFLMVFLGLIFHLMSLNTLKYLALVGVAVLAAGWQYLLHMIVTWPDMGLWLTFGTETALTGVIAIGLMVAFWLYFKRHHLPKLETLAHDG